MHRHFESTGFTPPAGRVLGRERRTVALAELLATIALALGTVIAVTAVSVGIARAATPMPRASAAAPAAIHDSHHL